MTNPYAYIGLIFAAMGLVMLVLWACQRADVNAACADKDWHQCLKCGGYFNTSNGKRFADKPKDAPETCKAGVCEACDGKVWQQFSTVAGAQHDGASKPSPGGSIPSASAETPAAVVNDLKQ